MCIRDRQNDVIQVRRHFHHVDGQFDIHIALDLAAAEGIGEFLGRLGLHGEAVIVVPIYQGSNRRIFLIFQLGGVGKCANEGAFSGKRVQETLVINVDAQCARRRIQISAVDKKTTLFVWAEI